MAAGALQLGVLLALVICVGVVRAADTVAVGRPLTVGQTLVSPSRKFALGFFQPEGGAAGSWYIGIWFNNIAVQTPVWVANRDKPVSDPSSSRFTITTDGNLALLDDSEGSIVWSTSANTSGATDTVAVLLDSGNLVLSPASNASAVLWQSFDQVSNTWLPGRKLRRDKRTGNIQELVSWRARGDPAPGMYTFQLDQSGAPQYVLLANRTREYWLTGNWTGAYFAGALEVAAPNWDPGYSIEFVDNDEETYFMYNFAANTTVCQLVLDVSGQLKASFWVEATQAWTLGWAEPKARCSVPQGCGAFGVCGEGTDTACSCTRGFRPRSPANWGFGDYIDGCVRNTELQCTKNMANDTDSSGLKKAGQDKFLRMDGTTLPDNSQVADAASSSDCQRACLGDCTCSAYAYYGSCFLWHGDLQNLHAGMGGNQTGAGNLYLRLAASELPGARSHKWRSIKIAVVALGIVCLVVAASILLVRTMQRRIRARATGLTVRDGCVSYKYKDLQYLTKNFADKIGEGAFGSVFKGQFSDNTLLAVKKLEGLRQGEKQFRAEVSTLGMIQHVNLIRMLGFCSDADRKLLVYEYMPNGSLDQHLFGSGRTTFCLLSWRVRYQVALGVAKGLAYLHERCRSCIIHCDVKPENILLDATFTPKVADFGLAKLMGRDFSRVLTSMRGTIGYLAPEWIGGEEITAKADVFSYGMMLFEIMSGRRNTAQGNLLSEMFPGNVDDHMTTRTMRFYPLLVAWRLKEEGDLTALLDPKLEGNVNTEEMRRMCKVACSCIQHDVNARPTMAEVVQVLEGLMEVKIPPVPHYLDELVGRGQPIDEAAYQGLFDIWSTSSSAKDSVSS